jgi:membrane protease YdiL (CAAX protease family)
MSKLSILFLCASLFLHAEESLLSAEATSSEISLLDLSPPSISFESSPIAAPPEDFSEMVPPELKKHKSPSLAVFLSALAPGLGHYYLGDNRMGSELLGGALLGGAAAVAAKNDPSLFATSLYTVQAVGSYSIFAAYRDAKIHNGNAPPAMPRDSFKSLSAAPFQWSVLKKPEVWGGFLGAITVGVTTAYFAYPQEASMRIKTEYVEPLSALPIAIAEESLFRGFLQTSLLDSMPAWGAITLSSLAFGAAHIPNALLMERPDRWRYYAFSIPFITSLGGYMGWVAYKNRSLKESVAFHTWYDFTLMAAGAFASKAAIGGSANLFYAFEF